MSKFEIEVDYKAPEEDLLHFIKDFEIDRKTQFEILVNAANQRDFMTLKRIAHNWKGFCAPYGYPGLAELATSLEKEAQMESAENCRAILFAMKNYFVAKSSILAKLN
ncbi:MAG: Hpt domain-containing protein [Bdellovibrionales bacterium]|nr:Hpt domain-containing protein [Bdellovibrionales bacterium]